ncbi:hypothetical protein AAMO2058_001019800 [Amorphochlora amoebiformis]
MEEARSRHLPETKANSGAISCSCGVLCGPLDMYIAHIERQCPELPKDPSGWASRCFQFLPDTNRVQRGVIAKNTFNYSFYVPIKLKAIPEPNPFLQLVAKVPKLCDDLKLAQAPCTIAIRGQIWASLGGKCPENLKSQFVNKKAYDGDNKVLFPAMDVDIIGIFKNNSLEDAEALADKFIDLFQPYTKVQPRIHRGFTYGGGKDLTGFVDGTNNFDETLRHLCKLCVMGGDSALEHPEDTHHGSTLFFAIFNHNLQSFSKMSTRDKSRSIGREYGVEKAMKGRDRRVENPRLGKDVSLQGHIFKAWGDMYRQSYPFCEADEEIKGIQHRKKFIDGISKAKPNEIKSKRKGLCFAAYSHDISHIDNALERMCGKWDKSRDLLFQFSTCVGGQYFYVPSLLQLETQLHLPKKYLQPKTSDDVVLPKEAKKVKASFVYKNCSNCESEECFATYPNSDLEECTSCERLFTLSSKTSQSQALTDGICEGPDPGPGTCAQA